VDGGSKPAEVNLARPHLKNKHWHTPMIQTAPGSEVGIAKSEDCMDKSTRPYLKEKKKKKD
jgi:hypothetical protein